jgi:hypothetical protein
MKKPVLFIIASLFLLPCTFAQVAINTDGSAANPSSALDVQFTDKGFLLPQMTYDQRNAITNPAEGLMVYCTNCGLYGTGKVCMFSKGKWRYINPCISGTPSEAAHDYTPGQITWKWHPVSGAAGYRWNSVCLFGSAEEMGTDTARIETVTGSDTTYYRYVWSYSVCGPSPPETLTFTAP